MSSWDFTIPGQRQTDTFSSLLPSHSASKGIFRTRTNDKHTKDDSPLYAASWHNPSSPVAEHNWPSGWYCVWAGVYGLAGGHAPTYKDGHSSSQPGSLSKDQMCHQNITPALSTGPCWWRRRQEPVAILPGEGGQGEVGPAHRVGEGRVCWG